jgi:hypothetical protein
MAYGICNPITLQKNILKNPVENRGRGTIYYNTLLNERF